MLQIRLSNNKGASTEGGTTIGGSISGGGSGKILLQGGGGGGGGGGGEIVTVACPDHLILADLPVAKSIGNINLSTSITTTTVASTVKIVGRRSRRHLGERVHFCVRCDFPIAIYGRLSPCEHAFCLDCARSDSSCYLCDERIQKIQTIKMMEGIFICAAPHCLKSFLKKSEFETHIHETHADLLQSNIEKEDGNELDTFNMPRPSSMDFTMSRASSIDAHAKQSIAADSSTARTPARTAFSPNSNSQPHDLDDRTRRSQPRDQPPQKSPIIQPKQPPFYARPPNYPPDLQSENKPSPVFDRAGPYNRFHNQQNFDMQAGPHQRRDSDQNPDKQQGIISELPSSEYLQHPLQQPNFVVPVNTNQRLAPAYNFSPFPAEGAHMFYNTRYEAMRPDMPSESGREQGSLLGFSPAPAGDVTSSDSYPRPWNMGAVMPFEQMPAGQEMSESYANQLDAQGRATLFQGDYGQVPGVIPPTPPMGNMGSEPLQGSSSSDNRDGKGVLAPQPRPPPPPPPPRHLSQFTRGNFPHPGDAASQEGLSYGWQHEKHDRYGGSQD